MSYYSTNEKEINNDKTLKKSKKLWGNAGDEYTIMSNYFIRYYKRLGLSHAEKCLLDLILSFKHTENDPYPAVSTLCELYYGDYTSNRDRNMREKLRDFENRGYLRIIKRYNHYGSRESNAYDLSPLLMSISKLAFDMKEEDPPVTEQQDPPVTEQQEGDVTRQQDPPVTEQQGKKNLEKENYKKKRGKENLSSHSKSNDPKRRSAKETNNEQEIRKQRMQLFSKVANSDLSEGDKELLILEIQKGKIKDMKTIEKTLQEWKNHVAVL